MAFAGHLAHPHQSVEVALCSISDTWKHEAVGISGLQHRHLTPMGNKEQQAEGWKPGRKKEKLYNVEATTEAASDGSTTRVKEKGNDVKRSPRNQ